MANQLKLAPFMFYRGIDSNGDAVIVVKLTVAGIDKPYQIILPKTEVERLNQCCADSLAWLNSDDPISTLNGPTNFDEKTEMSDLMKRAENYQRGLL